MLLILMSVVDHSGSIDRKDFANRLFEWMKKGYPELGDRGVCMYVCACVLCLCIYNMYIYVCVCVCVIKAT